ncbi:hypothetical protein GCM10010182_79700 [Actinomadura cremea]|nr:hypothetical protein GCM10010182_79700 [Actinomadura cremea]
MMFGRFGNPDPDDCVRIVQKPRTQRMHWVPRRLTDERKLDAVERLVQLAREAGMSPTHLAMAFAITHPAVTSAIIGPLDVSHVPPSITDRDLRRRVPGERAAVSA